MHTVGRSSVWILIAATLLLGACSDSNAPPTNTVNAAAASKAAGEAQAANALKLYEQMRSSQSWDLAASLGDELVKKYPGTAAATQVQQTIADVHAKGDAQITARRLARLWTYNAVPEAGGTQYSAAIESHEPIKAPGAKPARIRLVLRQHPQWGQSVYLLLDNATFDCSKGCATLPVSFDTAPVQQMKATIPPTGEPALFIDDDKGFIAKIQKTKNVAIDVTIKGAGRQTVVFEVGGYDPSKMPQRPKK